uniref:GDP-L-fucose synthase n=1 Tax=candidate division WOR-3 bacterium TaxID=2052148 RepID=A0A7C4TGT2_UNCW3
MEKIVITGATGFLGTHITKEFRNLGGYKIIPLSSKDYNLLKESEVIKMFEETGPDYLVHLAAKSGGILSNRKFPADYYFENIMLITLVFHYAYKYKVKRLLIPIGGCSYPATAPSPIKEESMWDGFPQIESAGYSVAKKMALVQSWAYKQQFGFDSVVVIPGNVYGEYDNFSLTESHVIPAMIRKFYEAKLNNLEELTFWGSGKPVRDFVYAGDVAKLFPYFLLEYKGDSPINISTEKSTSIKELAEHIARIIGYEGKIRWDTTYPDGQMVKIFSCEKLKRLGKSCDTPLTKGLERTIKWFTENYNKGTVRL